MLNPLKIISNIIKSSNQKNLDNLKSVVKKVNELENTLSELKDDEFPKKTETLKGRVKKGENLRNLLPDAYALVREASKRTRGERHFDVQIMGGIVLHNGNIAEMKTGEGKTLTIVLAAYLNALNGDGVHVVTVNDYLAKRDCLEMGVIYKFLGLTSGYINNDQNDEERKKNYDCDITYATNSELGFDYLRDNMKFSKKEFVQRGHKFAIVDEIDSCLIDEARTPLVISGAAENKEGQYLAVDKLVKRLNEKDYELDEKDKNIFLTNVGISNVEKIFDQAGLLKNNNLYDPNNLSLVHFVNQALRANHLFKKGKDYIIVEGELKIIDELTGRILEGRRYGDGLHQALEAKERIEIQVENQTLASITYQNYFKLYKKLSGCTGTALTEAEEFREIYNLDVTVIPTNKKMIRKDWNDQIFRTESEKNNAIIKKIQECYESGQPMLVFTSSVNKSEVYSELLKKNKIPHTVLNAKNHEREADIIADAGKLKSIIITTSISGRGVDIKLGGKKSNIGSTEDQTEKNKIKTLGGLFVLGTERMESRRVDNQARGRSGRQGDEGNSIFYVSLEDDLMRIFGSESMTNVLEKLGLKDGESIDHPWINKALERAQQKVESRNFDIRKTLLKFDNVLNDQRQVIFSQRKDIINSDDIFKYSNNFLNEIISELLKYKDSKDFESQIRILFGKSFDDNEVMQLTQNDNKVFTENIEKKFLEKRKERVNIIGEGGSGGAIALASSSKVLMLENAIYSVISPEGCASILWRDPKKTLEAATAMKLSSKDLLDLNIIDEIIEEPIGGAHRDKDKLILQTNIVNEIIQKIKSNKINYILIVFVFVILILFGLLI